MKIDVCLEMIRTDLPYEKRIETIAKAGFKCVEFWFHDSTFDGKTCTSDQPKDASTLRQVCKESGVTINNMVVNSPDGALGGAIVDAADLSKYIERLHEVIEFSHDAGISKSITCTGNMPANLSRSQMRANLEKALSEAAVVAERENYTLFVEVLNSLVDHPGYYLDNWHEGVEIVKAINSPNIKLLYDVYHMQIMHGNVIATIEKDIDVIGHFHSANVPGRGELMAGELNYRDVISRIAATGYTGLFGLEYMPTMADHSESLSATRTFLSDFD
ncbi:MAG: TIM barrel protein [Armatimonadetes bacterium]|nr:TIM barrel protein [Armatimonadota bacterium]